MISIVIPVFNERDRPHEDVEAGERLGMIKFGSRTEVSVPAELVQEALVQVGDTVYGGCTILLRMKKSS